MRSGIIFLLVVFGCYHHSDGQNVKIQGKGKILLEPFKYGEVQLTGGSLRRQLDDVKEYYLAIPNDDLLKGFRQRMHLPVWGAMDLGGWYSKDFYNPFGQIVAGLSRLYAVTGDDVCKQKVRALVHEWGKCIDSTGYFFYSSNPNAPHYEYEKILGGLLDAYQFTGDEEALPYLSRITDWCIRNLTRDHTQAGEWYTLAENLYRAYQVTGDKKYLDFGNEWEYHSYWDALKDKRKDILDPNAHLMDNPHAYSHLNTLSSAAEAYILKGEEDYKKTIINGYDFFINEQCLATGGYGISEFLRSKEGQITGLSDNHRSFETQCGSWAAFKLCKYLMMVTGDGRFGDWIEKLMINGIGASIPMSADGKVMYYSDYNPREGRKENFFDSWSCCTGTRPQAVAEYADLVYFRDTSGIYVNIFTPSVVKWRGVTLSQSARFPESEEVSFKVNTATLSRFSLYFRNPSWLKKTPDVWVNGKKTEALLTSHSSDKNAGWFRIRREWKDGDLVQLRFPMDFDISRIDPAKRYPAAITYGPVVLALRSGDFAYPDDFPDLQELRKNFIPVPGEQLNFYVKNNPGFLIRPYYQFKANEPYIMYFDPKVKNEVRYSKIATTGDWHGQSQFSIEEGAAVSATFTGTGVRFKATKFENAGKLRVEIDNKIVDTIDLYGGKGFAFGAPFEKKYGGLARGNHKIMLTSIPERNIDSKGTFVNFQGFEEIKE